MSGQEALLRPAKGGFIWGSLLVAFVLALIPAGRVLWLPDVLAMTLAFWGTHAHRRVGLGAAFAFGLALDVHQATLRGQHALAYAVLLYGAIMLHRRVLWFPTAAQALQLLPLFALVHVIPIALRLLGGAAFPGWPLLLAPLLQAALWPLLSAILLAPQRLAPSNEAPRRRGSGRKLQTKTW